MLFPIVLPLFSFCTLRATLYVEVNDIYDTSGVRWICLLGHRKHKQHEYWTSLKYMEKWVMEIIILFCSLSPGSVASKIILIGVRVLQKVKNRWLKQLFYRIPPWLYHVHWNIFPPLSAGFMYNITGHGFVYTYTH